MPINMQCPSCGKTLAAPDSAAGKQAKCPQCAKVITVPAPAAAAAQTYDVAEPAAPAPSGAEPCAGLARNAAK